LEKIFILDAENTLSTLERLSANLNSLEGKELESYIVTVHGVKSALAGIGEKELSCLAYKLEQAGGAKNYNLMARDTPVLIDALSGLVKKFKPAEVEGVLEISREDIVFLREKLDDIKSACESFNMKAAKKSLSDLMQKTWPRTTTSICEEISVGLLRGELKKVLTAIEKIAAMHVI